MLPSSISAVHTRGSLGRARGCMLLAHWGFSLPQAEARTAAATPCSRTRGQQQCGPCGRTRPSDSQGGDVPRTYILDKTSSIFSPYFPFYYILLIYNILIIIILKFLPVDFWMPEGSVSLGLCLVLVLIFPPSFQSYSSVFWQPGNCLLTTSHYENCKGCTWYHLSWKIHRFLS